MARSIVLRVGNEESAFGLTKVDREKLYGKKQRVVVDEAGRPCAAAWLTTDGTALVPGGGTAHVYVDEKWDTTAHGSRRAVSLEGEVLAVIPSTLGVAQDAVEVPPEVLLDHVTSVVYQLAPESLSPALAAGLAAGKIFSAPFNYREGHEPDVLFVVQNDEGIFGLVTRPTGFELVARESLANEPDALGEGDDLDDDLDFSMM